MRSYNPKRGRVIDIQHDARFTERNQRFLPPPSAVGMNRPEPVTQLNGEKTRSVESARVWADKRFPINYQIFNASGAPLGEIGSCEHAQLFERVLKRIPWRGSIVMRQKEPPAFRAYAQEQHDARQREALRREEQQAYGRYGREQLEGRFSRHSIWN